MLFGSGGKRNERERAAFFKLVTSSLSLSLASHDTRRCDEVRFRAGIIPRQLAFEENVSHTLYVSLQSTDVMGEEREARPRPVINSQSGSVVGDDTSFFLFPLPTTSSRV